MREVPKSARYFGFELFVHGLANHQMRELGAKNSDDVSPDLEIGLTFGFGRFMSTPRVCSPHSTLGPIHSVGFGFRMVLASFGGVFVSVGTCRGFKRARRSTSRGGGSRRELHYTCRWHRANSCELAVDCTLPV